jgi:transposase
MDVHKEAIVIAVLNEGGKLVMESVIETKASSILQFIHGLRGELHVTWEEGTWAAWLYDLLQPQLQHIVVCNPRRNALLKEGSKSDKVDARKLADLLRTGMLRPVYHGENGLRTLRELGRSYQTISKDLTRVMNRLKALYRGWGIPCAGTQVYAACAREEWLSKIPQAGVRRRAELLYQQLDGLQALRREVRPEFLAESRKHKAAKLLRQIPCIGPIRAARLIARMQTPHRFRSKRQLWTYSGLGSRSRRRPRPGARRLQRFPHSLERRRPRHPHPERSQSRVREAAIVVDQSTRRPCPQQMNERVGATTAKTVDPRFPIWNRSSLPSCSPP